MCPRQIYTSCLIPLSIVAFSFFLQHTKGEEKSERKKKHMQHASRVADRLLHLFLPSFLALLPLPLFSGVVVASGRFSALGRAEYEYILHSVVDGERERERLRILSWHSRHRMASRAQGRKKGGGAIQYHPSSYLSFPTLPLSFGCFFLVCGFLSSTSYFLPPP